MTGRVALEFEGVDRRDGDHRASQDGSTARPTASPRIPNCRWAEPSARPEPWRGRCRGRVLGGPIGGGIAGGRPWLRDRGRRGVALARDPSGGCVEPSGGIHRMMHPASPSARPHPKVRATPVDCRMDKRAFAARAVLGSAWQTESSVTASVEIGRLGLPKGGFSRTGRCSLGMEPNARGSWQGRRGGHRPCRSGSS
jgi:hypothetical protein